MNRLILNMSPEEYHATDAISVSGLKEILRSPRHYQHKYLEGNREETKALAFGQAFHAMVLEPERFESMIAIEPIINKRTNAGKDEYSAFLAENAGKTIITAEEFKQARAMAAEIAKHPMAKVLLSGKGRAELSGFWTEGEGEDAVNCRLRFDWLRDDNLIIDLKTILNASSANIIRDSYKYGYHMSGHWYQRGFQEITGNEAAGKAFIFCEKEAPHCVNVFIAQRGKTDDFLDLGAMHCNKALEMYRQARKTNIWQGYSDNVADFNYLDLPAWAKRELTEGDYNV